MTRPCEHTTPDPAMLGVPWTELHCRACWLYLNTKRWRRYWDTGDWNQSLYLLCPCRGDFVKNEDGTTKTVFCPTCTPGYQNKPVMLCHHPLQDNKEITILDCIGCNLDWEPKQ